ncbi:Gfo/Idh/MocA family oxidoreductase [Lentisphaera profundi]|uniref:Gfo/Idh/MocA family oxidoreductase n=1 Tax=Lentisphaera profundi TaxID=1658616 RepID=A0ABY7VSL9_9BACT|nr:Gfo/Idh/MocA family oxidoreductase [Lentisphaera profundi]WDE95769.1 Gfo/Idh/MocA family oxidoreductase [Lentisphaera profundi]
MKKIKILVVGCGNMGRSHALAYHQLEGFEICGIVSRGKSKELLNQELGGSHALFSDYAEALQTSKPDAVCISTYPDTHEKFALMAFEVNCHVFLEKPIAPTIEACERVVNAAIKADKKLLVGYILQHHPSWKKFIDLSQNMGKPLVMRMNLNQQSKGEMWETHKSLMNSMSPIVDCGVHYVEVMCQMTAEKPIRVSAIGANLSSDIKPGMYNYGQLQVTFDGGSVGWYEAGWGPMASTKAFSIKDVWGPKGAVTMGADKPLNEQQSDNVDSHSKTGGLRIHSAEIDDNNQFINNDEWIDTGDEPDHDGLCFLEQEYFLKSILENIDLNEHMQGAIDSLKIVLAADKSFKTGQTISL